MLYNCFCVCPSAGGVLPVALTYFAEFCPRKGRGRKIGSLLVFQLGGAVLAASLAWLLIHDRGTDRRFIHLRVIFSYMISAIYRNISI